jgi:hypothetical protein
LRANGRCNFIPSAPTKKDAPVTSAEAPICQTSFVIRQPSFVIRQPSFVTPALAPERSAGASVRHSPTASTLTAHTLYFRSTLEIKDPFVVKDGYVELPTRPGLGIELARDALESKIDRVWRNQAALYLLGS